LNYSKKIFDFFGELSATIMNVKDILLKNSKNCPDKCAIYFEDNSISYLELKDSSFKVANHLLKLGVKKSDKVATYLSNTPETIFALLGTFSIGASVVPLDFMLTQEEIINFLNHSQAKILITQPKKNVDLAGIKNSCLNLEKIIICKEKQEGFVWWDEILNKQTTDEPQVKIEEDDLSSIFYTSGSTGHPKGVMLNYRHLDNPVKVIGGYLGVGAKDIFLCGGVPFSHIGGLDYILMMLYFTSTLVLLERFHPLEFLKSLDKYKVTIFCIVPAMYVAILSLKGYDIFDLSSLRYAVVFGAPSSPVLLKKFHKICPNAIALNGWGMTETAAPNTYSPADDEKISSIGKFGLWMEAKIVDEDEKQLGPNSQGELWVRGEAIMQGYYKEPGLTREVLTDDGWLKTGDIVRLDTDGLYYIVGRKKDMIKVAGEIVFPAEVEEKIQRHPKIKEVAIIGVPDKLRGEVPKAFITTKENENLVIEELREFLKEHLAHFKIPHYFELVESLPKNRTGKIDKTKLK
jgi:long-chain acyl-CoA synthetase